MSTEGRDRWQQLWGIAPEQDPETPASLLAEAADLLRDAWEMHRSLRLNIDGCRGAVEYQLHLIGTAQDLIRRALAFDPDQPGSAEHQAASVTSDAEFALLPNKMWALPQTATLFPRSSLWRGPKVAVLWGSLGSGDGYRDVAADEDLHGPVDGLHLAADSAVLRSGAFNELDQFMSFLRARQFKAAARVVQNVLCHLNSPFGCGDLRVDVAGAPIAEAGAPADEAGGAA